MLFFLLCRPEEDERDALLDVLSFSFSFFVEEVETEEEESGDDEKVSQL